jgi:glucosylceramidase
MTQLLNNPTFFLPILLLATFCVTAIECSSLSQWRTCATNEDRLTRYPDIPFQIPSITSFTSSSCIYKKQCPSSCSLPGQACATVCGPPYTGGACSCGETPGCGSSCQGCPDCSQCCCRPAKHLLEVDASLQYQTVFGFGGAFTEAAALNFFSLSDSDQEMVLDAYFGSPFDESGSGGHGYQLGRIPINSCDFSPKQFSYDNYTNDSTDLPHFDHNVVHDTNQVIPFVLKAQERAERARKARNMEEEEKLFLFGSPWSPPAWMKNPGGNRPSLSSMSGSNPIQGLSTNQQQAWSNYLSYWVTSFKQKGVNIWGITVQNEAEFAAPWESCVYNASFQSNFIGNYLGPTLKKDHPSLKIMAYDHNKDHIAQWAKELSSNEQCMKYLSGMAFHWYLNGPGCSIGTGDCMEEGATNLITAHELLTNTSNPGNASSSSTSAISEPFLLATESCNCPGIADDTPSHDEMIGKGWERGERLMSDAISDMNHYSIGYVDWNLLVNYRGGPNHLGNYCDANIVADPNLILNRNNISGAGQPVVLRPSYYMLGHVARFAPRGSIRIHSSFSVVGNDDNERELISNFIDVVAFQMKNGSTSVVILNRGEQTVEYTLRDKLTGREVDLEAIPHSAQSLIF